MSLKYEDQYRLAMVEEAFASRVSAAMFAAAVNAFLQPPLENPDQQYRRITLANTIVNDVKAYSAPFRWICVYDVTINSLDQLTDEYLTTTCKAFFDPISQLVIKPQPTGTPA